MRFAVLIPTYRHATTLALAVESVLAQTHEDFEILVVGDGPDDATDSAAREIAASYPLVRYFPFPKGEGNGELHRHQVLVEEAQCDAVAYLPDDDLYRRSHLAGLETALQNADVAHVQTVFVDPDGSVRIRVGDLSKPFWRRQIESGPNFLPLGAIGHTMDFYRRLPHGWRPRPEGTFSDHHMWRQMVGVKDARFAMVSAFSLLHFPSPHRPDATLEERAEELRHWWDRLRQPSFDRELQTMVIEVFARREGRRLKLESNRPQSSNDSS